LTSTIAKRQALHRQLSQQQKDKDAFEKKLMQLEGLANLGSATAMIAHELNNLLTPLANYAELSLQSPEDRVLVERALRKTAHNCRQAAKVMESILEIANAGGVKKVETPLLPLISVVFACLCRDFKSDSITVDIHVDENLRVWAVPVQLQHALMNLILNAREAMLPKGGKLTIEAQDEAENVRIKVSDTGCGIAQQDLGRVFDSFFSTKNFAGFSEPTRTSNGLGLALCKKVIDAHTGSITVDSHPGRGSTFTILLPKK
jgi:two-component system NtrC family sensor kinase